MKVKQVALRLLASCRGSYSCEEKFLFSDPSDFV